MEIPRDTETALEFGEALLLGDQVRLRPLLESDLPVLEAWWEDPKWQPLQQLTVRPRPAGSSVEMFRRWSSNDGHGAAGFSIEARETGEFVGHITLFGASLPVREATLAIIVGPDHVGHGIGTDAVRTMVRYGFLVMGLNRIELRTFAYNSRARRAYARAGFVEEGIRREAVFVAGGFTDEVIMSVLRADWDRAEAATHPPGRP
jgi:RimJ/RimL family protein N-acetyltransferase